MKTKLLATLAVIAATASPITLASDVRQINTGTGGKEGNYFDMVNDIAMYCEEDLSQSVLVPHVSDGSTSNLLGMQNKKFAAGVVQEDVLNYHAKRSPKKVNKNRMKVIAGLHEEALHLLIPKGYQPKSAEKKGWKSWFSKGEKASPKIDLNMLRGQTIGSWGGSMVSAEAISYFFGLNMNVLEVPKEKRADVRVPLLLVGGYPYEPVENYLKTGNWHLVSLDYNQISEKADFYNEASVNYEIGGKVQSVKTVSVRALLLGKAFRKKSRNAPMSELATCITANIADLADDPDTNPNWNSVYDFMEDDGITEWSMFPIDEDLLAEYE